MHRHLFLGSCLVFIILQANVTDMRMTEKQHSKYRLNLAYIKSVNAK